MTGRYQQRFGHEFNPGPPATADADFGLPRSEDDPGRAAEGARATPPAWWASGTWATSREYHPLERGFDEFFGFLGGAHRTCPAERAARADPARHRAGREKEYLTDAFAREAVAFIERHRREPFFLYLAFNAVHTPLQATEKYLDRFAAIDDAKRRTYAAMLTRHGRRRRARAGEARRS